MVLILRAADRAPRAVGLKLTLMVQLPPAATVLQLFVCTNSPGLAPVKVMLRTPRGAPPVLDTVTGCDALVVPNVVLAKFRTIGDTLAFGNSPTLAVFEKADMSGQFPTATGVPGGGGTPHVVDDPRTGSV